MKNEILLELFKIYEGNKRATKLNERALKYGVIIPNNAPEEIVETAIKLYGIDKEKWNQTFHKDFNTVKNTDNETLIIQQLIHYFTTYGIENIFGEIKEDLVYIPKEELNIPELTEDINFVVIKPMNKKEISEKIMTLLTSGIALHKKTVDNLIEISDYIDLSDIDSITNREVKIALYNKYKIVPKDGEEFLRYLIYTLTESTLKIKNDITLSILNERAHFLNKDVERLLNTYVSNNSYKGLAEIFFRNKDLFLALKGSNKEVNRIINKIRKLADKYHKPIKKSLLDMLTDPSVNINDNDLEKISDKLDAITIFKEVRILNGVKYRLYGNNSIVYKIRNGKSWAKELNNNSEEYTKRLLKIEEIIMNHLISRLKYLEGRTVYIPENTVYAMPTSEKQFNGNFPAGSYIEIPRERDLIYGIHWTNLENHQVDLDLKQMNQSEVFGWDADYKSERANIIFSGDITNAPAPKGATELFYVGTNYGQGAFLVTVNDFTQNNEDVPFEFVIAKSDKMQANFKNNFVINPNNILTKIGMSIEKGSHQKVIGFITIDENVKFYFNDYSNGAARSSKMDEVQTMSFEYLNSYSKVQVKFNDLLKEAGVTIVTKKTEDSIDLSPEIITKETIIDLLTQKNN